MIQHFGSFIKGIFLLKDALKVISEKKDYGKKKEFQRKLVGFQLMILDVIETADKIFEVISENKRTGGSYDFVRDIQSLAYSQNYAIIKIITFIAQEELTDIVNIVEPGLNNSIKSLLNAKSHRLVYITKYKDYNGKGINELYNEKYLQEGKVLVDELKECSEDLGSLIKETINLEDILSLDIIQKKKDN